MTQTELNYKRRLNNYVDGFAYNTAVVPNPYMYQWLCVDAMQAVRLASGYRPKIYGVPDQGAYGPTGLAPFSDFVTQIRVIPGTFVVGLSLTVLNYFGLPTANSFALMSNLYADLTDDGTGVPFFSDYIANELWGVNTLYSDGVLTNISDFVPKTAWLPLTKPRAILAPGIITAKLSYKAEPGVSQNIAPQVLLICAEPCSAIRNTKECQ